MLIFLRHGRTPNNANALLQGQEDSPLDEVGFEQARRAGEYLRSIHRIDRAQTSHLTRTHQTAAAAGFGDYPTVIDPRWGEIDFGSYDLRKIGEVMAELGRRWLDDIEYVPPGGESMGSVYRRVAAACDELEAEYPGETIVIVTHATPIKAAAAWAIGGSADTMMRLRVSLASITVVEHGAGVRLLSSFNDTRHL